jgi:hypothetical protein
MSFMHSFHDDKQSKGVREIIRESDGC